MPLFGDAYLADTRHLSLEEHGAYLQLLMIAWRTADCALPDDDKRIAQMLSVSTAKWRKLKLEVMKFWTLDAGRWTQRRLLKERTFVNEKRAKNREAAEQRWGAKSLETKGAANANASPVQCERNAPPPPLSKKEDNNPPSGGSRYAFEGRVIRLQQREFGAWRKAYPDIDLMASLQSRDDWLATEADEKTRKRWFMSTSNHLANLQQKARRASTEAAAWDGMP